MVDAPALMHKRREKFEMVTFYMNLIPHDQFGNAGIPA